MDRGPHVRLFGGGILLAAALVASSVAPAAAQAKPRRLVITPARGRVVHGDTVRIRIRSAGPVRARLNGARIGGEFARTRGGRRVLLASASHGLRRGRNVLRVRVPRRGRPARRTTVRFRLRHRGPLVGAGRDRTVTLGDSWPLRGRVLKPAGRKPAPHVRWRIVSSPRDSTAKGAPRLRSAGGRTAAFRPDAPGEYQLSLAAAGDEGSTDLVDLRVLPSGPLLPVNTMFHAPDDPSIRVGSREFPLDNATGDHGDLQMLVLKRRTLEFVANRRFTQVADFSAALSALKDRDDDDDLVIAAMQSPTQRSAADDLHGLSFDKALGQIGSSFKGDVFLVPGVASAIGVPGMKPGDGDFKLINSDANRDPTRAQMRGYLGRDQYDNYGYIASLHIPFRFTPTTPQIPEGADVRPACGDYCAGLMVTVRDQYTGQVTKSVFYGTGDPKHCASCSMSRMVSDLTGISGVVTIRAVSVKPPGGTAYLPPVIESGNQAVYRQLVSLITAFGGTANGFNSVAVDPPPPEGHGSVYALVGWDGAGEGRGTEVAAGVDGATRDPTLQGVLRPDPDSRLRPQGATQVPTATGALSTVTLEPPTHSWPLKGDPAAQAAIDYLGEQDNRLGPHPREQYWRLNFPEPSQWLDIAHTIDRVEYPGSDDFSEATFVRARRELVQELEWVYRVRSYIQQISSPLAKGSATSWALTHVIADKIYKALKPPSDTAVAVRWLDFVNILLHMAGPFTANISSEIGDMLQLAVWGFGAQPDGSPTDDELRVSADQLGLKLEEQAEGATEATSKMGDVIVGDYDKLKLVGSNALCNPNAASCNKEFSFTGPDSRRAAADVNRAIQRLAYEKFFPTGYSVFKTARRRDPADLKFTQPPKVSTYTCGKGVLPFATAPDLSHVSLLADRDVAAQNNTYDTYVVGIDRNDDVTYPPKAILDRMFGRVPDDDNPDRGGLGISLTQMVLEAKPQYFSGSAGTEEQLCAWVKP